MSTEIDSIQFLRCRGSSRDEQFCWEPQAVIKAGCTPVDENVR
ncbi:hypothetical protein BRADI_4g41944v3 [Brachypodium distachyon]|uniref:Uncharacterized protein n=1 Tax=Brachypodium distachyon TaxID=15368 RepID=A0A0Q3J1C8_BRADI|nr:hypothetical protein BRADI_4g41944v3 [Brachypodium distachyon]